MSREGSGDRDFQLEKEGPPSDSEEVEEEKPAAKSQRKAGSSGRRWTKIEDPAAPKKPRSAYVLFLSARRANYGTVKQGCDQKSINVALAAEWQALDKEDRQVYLDLATKERNEYQQAMRSYQKTESYAAFMSKKELILRQRKQCRKMGLAADSAHIENLVFGKEENAKRRRKQKSGDSFDYGPEPTLPNSKIPIFSSEFMEYNRERESELRSVRRAIGVAEDEQASMRRTIERLQANCDALRTRQAADSDLLKNVDLITESWQRTIDSCLEKANIGANCELIDFFEDLSHKKNNSSHEAVAKALHDVNFVISLTKLTSPKK